MSKERVIHLIGGISDWNVSHDYVKYMIDELGAGPITVKVTSPGGDVNQALLIKSLFEQHGEVTIEYVGFNASAATLIGHGAAKTTIREDSLYLIHKPAVWVDTWGRMNADELAAAIVELENQKKDAEKITLMIAQDYVNSRGMELAVVETLMKDARWLTAKEAVDLGLIDELIPSKTKKAVITNEVLAMMTVNGYPVPVIDDETVSGKQSILQTIINKLSPKNQIEMNKDFSCINEVLAIDGIEVKDGKIELSIEQITSLNTRLQTKQTEVVNLTTERDNAVTARTTAETALNDFTTLVNEIDPAVATAENAAAKVSAIKAKLASRPAVAAAAPQGGSGANDHDTKEADFDTIDQLPHNQAADKEVY
jgi:ATP-dependent protease ClpP protease subunit